MGFCLQCDQAVVARSAVDAGVGERLEETVALLIVELQHCVVEATGENARGDCWCDCKARWQACEH